MVNNKYYISLNSWHNINSSRICFYQWILENYKSKGIITKQDLSDFLVQNHYSNRFIDDEVIGCFYAGFLSPKDNGYTLTKRVIYDFNTLLKEASNIKRRLGFTIDFDKTSLRVLINYTMPEPKWLLDFLKFMGFSLNKSKFCYLKKYKYEGINQLL